MRNGPPVRRWSPLGSVIINWGPPTIRTLSALDFDDVSATIPQEGRQARNPAIPQTPANDQPQNLKQEGRCRTVPMRLIRRPVRRRSTIRVSFPTTMKQKIVTVLVVFTAPLPVLQSAQAYPDRPIKLVVPSPAGGPPDQIARLLSDKMAAALGQPVIVENRTGGAGGIIGAKSVAA